MSSSSSNAMATGEKKKETPPTSSGAPSGASSDSAKDNMGANPSGIRLLDTAALNSSSSTQRPVTAATSSNNKNNTTVIGSTTVSGLPLDWTKLGSGGEEDHLEPILRYPTDVVSELDVTDGEFVLVGTAGLKITNLGPDFSKLLTKACQAQEVPHLTKLILRSHMIATMEGLELLHHLELLELYDNQVQALVLTPNFSATLTVLDMSYNSIRDMSAVQVCPHLKELYLANNKLKAIEGLRGLKELRKLDLGANRIRIMPPDELAGLEQLEELWLGKNKIERIQGLTTLSKLRRLDLQSNRIGNIVNEPREGVAQGEEQFATISATLEELFLAHNGISQLGSWLLGNSASNRTFPELIVLDMSRNQLADVNALGSSTMFPVLEELWLAGNQVAEWSAADQLSNLSTVETLYLEYNPIQTNDPLYRKSLAERIPQLKQIDATMISATASNALVGTSGLVTGARTSGLVTGASSAQQPPSALAMTANLVESDQDRMRRFQEMALQRAAQETRQLQQSSAAQQNQNGNDDDSDDSG